MIWKWLETSNGRAFTRCLLASIAILAASHARVSAQEGVDPPPSPVDPGPASDTQDYGGFFKIAAKSIFGPSDYKPWTPLSFRTLFTEGWDQPWIAEPNDSSDGQQGWINAADGNFYRLSFFSYTFTNHLSQGGNGNLGSYTLYTPLNRRLELITFIPFVTNQPTFGVGKQSFTSSVMNSHHPTSSGFGDITLTPRVMLIDREMFSLNAQMAIQTPTGYRRTGSGQAIVTPGVQSWWNFSDNWVARAGFNVGVGTNPQAGGTKLLSQFAIGRVLTPHDIPLFGDFTVYLSSNTVDSLRTGGTTSTLTPGLRSHIGNNWYALAGTEIPVTGHHPFQQSAIFWLMKTF